MLNFLQQPYPKPLSEPGQVALASALVGVFTAAFLIVFKPFGTDRVVMDNLDGFLAGYGLVVALAIGVPTLLIPRIFPKLFLEADWTVLRQIVMVFLILAIAITASYGYLMLLDGTPNLRDYLYFFRNSLFIASFPVVVITLLDYIRKLRYYESGAARMNAERRGRVARPPLPDPGSTPASGPADKSAHIPTQPTERLPLIRLTDSQGREELAASSSNIWCLHSDGNYVEVWTVQDDGSHERILIRNTISALTGQLPDREFLICHRSWVVNPGLVDDVTGNAQGYQLHRAGAPSVAVARGRSREVMSRLEEV